MPHPWPITKKIVASDYVSDPYSCGKFGANPSTGGFWANGWNITKFLLPRDAMLCHGPVSVCLSVRLSVYHKSDTSRCSTKTAKRRITQITPHDRPGTLVFWRQRSPRNSTGVTPMGAPNAGGVGQNRRLLTNNRLYLENGNRQTHSFY